MPSSIQLIDRNEGLSSEEVTGRLSTGWLCVSNIAITGPALAIPGQHEIGRFVDAWLAPPYGAMMPQLAVVQALLLAEDKGADVITLDDLSKMWFNQSLRQLRQAVAQPPEEKDAQDIPQDEE